jgi:hypothetical protein
MTSQAKQKYTKLIKQHGIQQSMSRKGDCWHITLVYIGLLGINYKLYIVMYYVGTSLLNFKKYQHVINLFNVCF